MRGRLASLIADGSGGSVASVPLRVTQGFVVVLALAGFFAGRNVHRTSLVDEPEIRTLDDALRAFEPGSGALENSYPSIGWALAAGLGVAIVYGLSILAHELGHLVAARRIGVEPVGLELRAAGGFVELDDDDLLTAGRLAALAAAGPLVTAFLALAFAVALTALGWPLVGTPSDSAADVAAGRVLSAAFMINVIALVVNLLPIRPLDGAHLLTAARLWRGRS